jgi:hypothetical protein
MKTAPFLLPFVGANTQNITALKIGLLLLTNNIDITMLQGCYNMIITLLYQFYNNHITERKKERKKFYTRACARMIPRARV